MRKFFSGFLLLLLICSAGLLCFVFMLPNIQGKHASVKIPTGSGYEDVLRILKENNVLKNEFGFVLVSKLKKYPEKIKPGYYVFSGKMNNRQIVNMLRAGLQTPVTLVIYNIRTKEEFSELVGKTLELDSNLLLAKLNDDSFCKNYGTDTNNIVSRFIVDNYEFYWDVSENDFFEKFKAAYEVFWNQERRKKAEALNLAPRQVVILASIVEKEVFRDTELARVAGVYCNRLKIGMSLQADPTLLFALRDFDAKRVNSTHKEFDSPYNTYRYAGLPPGPICMPRKKSIDAVLNHEVNDYLYFCANPDMSGYSVFSKTYGQQMKVADEYRKKLNQLNIH